MCLNASTNKSILRPESRFTFIFTIGTGFSFFDNSILFIISNFSFVKLKAFFVALFVIALTQSCPKNHSVTQRNSKLRGNKYSLTLQKKELAIFISSLFLGGLYQAKSQ